MAHGQFFFAWVDGDQTTFESGFDRVDEDVLDFAIDHEEGQVPTLDITVRNPRVGLLAPGRKQWAWLSYEGPSGSVIPLFFGVLIGVPSNLFAETVQLKFIARPTDFILQKQAVAESMKTRPFYDPVWISQDKRDDPDTILEGWSKLWHVDRTSPTVTASDILEGEDGTITFTEDDALYDSVSVSVGSAPLTDIRVEANVTWTQRTSGFVTWPTLGVASYTGDTFISDWPKPGGSLGGGWSVESSFVQDVYLVKLTPTVTTSSNWTNKDDEAKQINCNSSSAGSNASFPALLSPSPLSTSLTFQQTIGDCDPFSDPPVNKAASNNETGMIVPLWSLNCLALTRYDAKRQFSENIAFDVVANTQAILTSPQIGQDTELITMSADVGKPLQELEAWTDFAGQAVPIGQIIYPNDPSKPGGTSHQICVVAGIAGTDEPVFSDIPGDIVFDGTVTWASMGQSPLTDEPDWVAAQFVPLGQLICYQSQYFNAAAGKFENGAHTSYYICTKPGQTNASYTTFFYTPWATDSDQGAGVPIRVDYIARPEFSLVPGAQIADGTVVWTVIGEDPPILKIPIGGTPDNVTARSYFPSDRGLWSVEYLIAVARARLRLRARAITVEWTSPFESVMNLSCRMNATIYDPRLPGAVATGKITKYTLTADGKTGALRGTVTIGCSVGHGNSVADITGTPEYTAASGYCSPGYQLYDGGQYALPDEDVAYSPPAYKPFDDGISFPIHSVREISNWPGQFSLDAGTQAGIIQGAFPAQKELANLDHIGGATGATSNHTASGAWWQTLTKIYLEQFSVPHVMQANPVAWTLTMKPVSGQSFYGSYDVQVSTLEVPKGIDLSAPSSP